MKWKKFTLTTTTEAVDLVSSMLDDVGIEGIEVEDNVPLTEKETKGMSLLLIQNWDSALLRHLRQRIRTGSTTGSSILSRLQ